MLARRASRKASKSGVVRVVDLFAGVGGFSLGFLNRNRTYRSVYWEVACLVDHDSEACMTFKRNYPHVKYLVKDVRALSAEKILEVAGGTPDVLVGGPPCQGLSRLGSRRADDPRNELVMALLKLGVQAEVPCMVVENVPHLKHGGLSSECLDLLGRDYQAEVRILNAKEHGVPQLRRRAFLLAVRKTAWRRPLLPFPKARTGSFVSVEEAIGDLPRLAPGEGTDPCAYTQSAQTTYQRSRRNGAGLLFNHVARKHSPNFLRKISIIPEGGRNLELPDESRFSDHYFSQAYARLASQKPAYTITTCFLNPGSGRFLHYRDLRSLTIREGARLQSFDDSFVFHGSAEAEARHIGNAVPPLLAAAWAKSLEAVFS